MDELENQIRFVLHLILFKDADERQFIRSQLKILNNISLSNTFLACNPFLRMASLIVWIKQQIIIRYSNIHWLKNETTQWRGTNQYVESQNMITLDDTEQRFREIHWCTEINKKKELSIVVRVKIINKGFIQLPLGVWNQDNQKKIQEEVIQNFELQLRCLINMLHE